MRLHHEGDRVQLWHGDALEVLRSLPDASVDSVVCDPPYGLEFMGKDCDAPWKSEDKGVHAEARTRRADEMVDENKRRFIASAVNKFAAGKPFQDWCEAWATECLRVLKPGGHLLAFGGTRTWHRLACAVEDAGFEVRDSIAWMYGSGFPKSLDVSKAIDKMDATDVRRARNLSFTEWMRSTGITSRQIDTATSSFMGGHYLTAREQAAVPTADMFDLIRPLISDEVPEWVEALVAQRTVESENYKRREVIAERRVTDRRGDGTVVGLGHAGNADITAPATPDAERWQGWGTALKPAFEPVVVARKPLTGTVAANVLEHGTGALNIDGCRVSLQADEDAAKLQARSGGVRGCADQYVGGTAKGAPPMDLSRGRWPTNVVLDESQAEVLDEQSGESKSPPVGSVANTKGGNTIGTFAHEGRPPSPNGHGDTGGASRFFPTFRYEAKAPRSERPKVNGTAHPTVKPLDLMRWLVRLVTPPGGTVLEPFAGSGTTVEAAIVEGFHCIAIEREADYLPLIMQRINRRLDPVAAIKQTGDDLGLFDLEGEGA